MLGRIASVGWVETQLSGCFTVCRVCNPTYACSTVPPRSGKNTKLANGRHPKTQVPFDNRGFPNFERFVKFDTKIDSDRFRSAKSPEDQMKMATEDLNKAIENGQISSSSFDAEQLAAIRSGKSKIPGYTWHHHQDTGRM